MQGVVDDVGLGDKHQGKQPDQGIDPQLGEHACKKSSHCSRQGVIGSRQPEKQGKQGGFNAECRHHQQGCVFHLGRFFMQVCQVQGAGKAVEQADGGYEKQGGQQV